MLDVDARSQIATLTSTPISSKGLYLRQENSKKNHKQYTIGQLSALMHTTASADAHNYQHCQKAQVFLL